MGKEERTKLFVVGDSRWTDPRIILLEEMLSGLPREKQIEQITETLKQEEIWNNLLGEQAIPLVEAIEKLFENQELAFRAHLMETYNAIPIEIDGDRHYKEKIEAAPKLKLAMLGKIIRGWDCVKKFGEKERLFEDAEKCFQFLCESYRIAPLRYNSGNYPNTYAQRDEGKIRKGILDLFREHLEKSKWRPPQFDSWIIRQDVPDAIALVLLKARTRHGGLAMGRKEISFLEAFDFHNRSGQAITLAQEYMAKVRLTDELAALLVKQVESISPRGGSGPDSKFQSFGDIKYNLESKNVAWVKIKFGWCLNYREGDKEIYPQVIRDIQILRDKLLDGIEDPPAILIEAEGPDGFHYKEE